MAIINFSLIEKPEIKALTQKNTQTIIGIPLQIEIREDPSVLRFETYLGFYGLNPSTANNSKDMYLDLSTNKELNALNSEIKSEIKEIFELAKTSINSNIQTENPNFFSNISSFCNLNKNYNNVDIEKEVVKSLLNKHSKPLIVAGLPGYGKTASIHATLKAIKSDSIEELISKYDIDKDEAKTLKSYSKSFNIEINPETEFGDLMAKLVLSKDPETKQQTTEIDNGALLSAIKTAYYLNENVVVFFDEIFDSQELMKSFKASLMPKDGKYNFPTNSARTFLGVEPENKINIAQLGKDKSFAFFEVAENCDTLLACSDKAIKVKDGKIEIDMFSLTEKERDNLTETLLSDASEESLNPKNIANTKKTFMNLLLDNIKDGRLKPVLISQAKADEIRTAKEMEITQTNMSISYVIDKNQFKVFGTGNALDGEIPFATLDRFKILHKDSISYNALLQDIAIHQYSIDSKLFKELDKYPQEAKIDLTKNIIDFVRFICDIQNKGTLPIVSFDNGLEPVYRKESLSSVSISPRLLTNIINNSSKPEDIITEFKNSAKSILGFYSLIEQEEEQYLAQFDIFVESKLKPSIKETCEKYKIANNLTEEYSELDEKLKTLPTITSLEEEKTTKSPSYLKPF